MTEPAEAPLGRWPGAAPLRSELLAAHEAGACKAELGRALAISRQRVDESSPGRPERAVGVEDQADTFTTASSCDRLRPESAHGPAVTR
jgi:hypothetical protein